MGPTLGCDLHEMSVNGQTVMPAGQATAAQYYGHSPSGPSQGILHALYVVLQVRDWFLVEVLNRVG